MGSELYVANFDPSTSEEQLSELFAQYGEVVGVTFAVDE
jgi:RNA recognition motif-containing protein